ncbi:fumarylacetoacetate hydrolase family protein [Variovorax sp. Root318D1]|uniref:fumarylacetoacetate hydrolase family protein n=1 Tax=Variovorax sp. Root318D1 TaxID=1736513 RepID=UPI0009EA73A7
MPADTRLGPCVGQVPNVVCIGLNSRTQIFGVATIVSYLSRFMALRPGDVIPTGTPPANHCLQRRHGRRLARWPLACALRGHQKTSSALGRGRSLPARHASATHGCGSGKAIAGLMSGCIPEDTTCGTPKI